MITEVKRNGPVTDLSNATERAAIARTADNGHLEDLNAIPGHQPEWMSWDCPSCGSAPCGPHPDVLVCSEDEEDWPCATVQAVAAELDLQAAAAVVAADRLIAGAEGFNEVSVLAAGGGHGALKNYASGLRQRATELRGGVA